MKNQKQKFPPANTPAYDALAEIGLAVVSGQQEKAEKLSKSYKSDFCEPEPSK